MSGLGFGVPLKGVQGLGFRVPLKVFRVEDLGLKPMTAASCLSRQALTITTFASMDRPPKQKVAQSNVHKKP